MNKIRYKAIGQRGLKRYQKQLLEFYDPDGKRNYLKSLKNVQFIIFALDGEKVIGGNKILTDFLQCAIFIDLTVKEEYRKRGIGAEILKLTIRTAMKYGIRNIILTTDARYPWLPSFYAKYGFKIAPENGAYMKLDNDSINI